MKQFVCRLMAFLLIAFCVAPIHAQEIARKKVAVYVTESDVDDAVKKIVQNKIISTLTHSPKYQILERNAEFLKAIHADRDFNHSGEVRDNDIAAIGKGLGAKFILVIDVSEVFDDLYIAARMVNAETGVVQDSAEELLSDPTSAKLVAAAEKIAKGVVGNTTSSSSTGTVSSTDGNIETFTVNGVTFDMVKVNDTFSIGKTEVTQRLWRAVMGNNPSKFLGENSPVEMVSWYDCQEFCDKLSQLTGRIFRLPTEAEWLYAARGGEKSRGYEYSGSNDLYRVAWYTENSGQMTHPVGQKMPNELGIFDMSGNVWEWCSDLYDSSDRVLRGGSWNSYASNCRVASRGSNPPVSRYGFNGFRLAL